MTGCWTSCIVSNMTTYITCHSGCPKCARKNAGRIALESVAHELSMQMDAAARSGDQSAANAFATARDFVRGAQFRLEEV